ncbi:MAG: hypothetical protein J5640_04070 [Bacteroidales bacterium]|nr:hypothetical protein [Bacteroidales bacterium]
MEQNSTQVTQPTKPMLVIDDRGSHSLSILRVISLIIGAVSLIGGIIWFASDGLRSIIGVVVLIALALISFLVSGLLKGAADIVVASELYIAKQEAEYEIRAK